MSTMDAVVEPALRDFRAVYRAHYGLVWHALYRLGVPPDALEDAVQDVFVVAFRRRDDYAGTSTKAWLYGIARRVASNLRRTRRRRAQRHSAVASVRPRSTSGSHEVIHSLDRYLSSLASDDRELFILSELEGMTGPEIAEARGRKVATIYTRIRKLRQDLDADLELERVRTERPRATAHGWALLMPSLGGTTAAKAAGASAILGSGWFLGSLAVAATMVITTTVVRSRADADRVAATTVEVEPAPKAGPAPRTAAGSEANVQPAVESEPEHVEASIAPVEPRSVAPVARPTAAPRPAPRPTGPTNALAEENRLLAQAERRLRSGDAAGALAVTDDHATRFADSAFTDLRTAVRIAALCELGRTAQARGEASLFLRKHPGSPVADRVRTRIEKNCTPSQENPPKPDNPGT